MFFFCVRDSSNSSVEGSKSSSKWAQTNVYKTCIRHYKVYVRKQSSSNYIGKSSKQSWKWAQISMQWWRTYKNIKKGTHVFMYFIGWQGTAQIPMGKAQNQARNELKQTCIGQQGICTLLYIVCFSGACICSYLHKRGFNGWHLFACVCSIFSKSRCYKCSYLHKRGFNEVVFALFFQANAASWRLFSPFSLFPCAKFEFVLLQFESCNACACVCVHIYICMFSTLLRTYLLIFAQARLQWVTPVCLLYPKLHYMQHLLLEIKWSACEHLWAQHGI